MHTYAEPIPSVTGFGYTDVPGRDGFEFRAVGAGPSDTNNYWQVSLSLSLSLSLSFSLSLSLSLIRVIRVI